MPPKIVAECRANVGRRWPGIQPLSCLCRSSGAPGQPVTISGGLCLHQGVRRPGGDALTCHLSVLPRPLQPPRHLPASLPCHATSWILMAALVCHSSITSTSSSQGQKYNLMPRQHYHAAAIAASSVLFTYVAVALDLPPYIASVYVLLAYIAVVVLLDDIAVMLLFISCWLTLQWCCLVGLYCCCCLFVAAVDLLAYIAVVVLLA